MIRVSMGFRVIVCAASFACNPDKRGSETGDGTTGTGEAGTDVGVTTGAPGTCDLPDVTDAVCGVVEVTCDGVEMLVDQAALDCTLTAMRDRTPGRVSLSRCENAGQNSYQYTWELRADGTTRRRHDAQIDFCSITGEVLVLELAPPAFLMDCLNTGDWETQLDCLTTVVDVVETCELGVEDCEEGV